MWLIGWFFDKSAGIKNPFKREKEIYPEEDKPKEEPEYNPEYKIDNTDCYE
jgi:hypothetical protein